MHDRIPPSLAWLVKRRRGIAARLQAAKEDRARLAQKVVEAEAVIAEHRSIIDKLDRRLRPLEIEIGCSGATSTGWIKPSSFTAYPLIPASWARHASSASLRPFLTGLTYPLGPWALGAIACGMRRAELAGDQPVTRRCAVGLVWALERTASVLGGMPATFLLRLAGRLRESVAAPGYIAELGLRISEAELKEFETARAQYIAVRTRWPCYRLPMRRFPR